MRQSAGPKPRVKISDVAEALGLSKGTVSRAMNAYPDISESTQLRVRRTAERMGYRPLSHAQAIKTGRVRALALVLEVSEYDGHAPFLTTFLSGVTEEASDNGWTLTVATAGAGKDMEETLRRLMQERKADGFILPRTRVNDPRVELLRSQHVPHILYGRTGYGDDFAQKGLSWYDISGGRAMTEAVVHLAKLGHTRIGFLGSRVEYNYALLRRDGYLNGLKRAGLPHDPDLEILENLETAEAARSAARLLRLPEPPTAIVGCTDLIALGAYQAAEDLNLEIGQDLSVVGYDGIPRGDYVKPRLSSFHVDSYAAGRRLAALLIRQIRGENPEELRELAPARFVQGGSDAPPRLSSAALAKKVAANSNS